MINNAMLPDHRTNRHRSGRRALTPEEDAVIDAGEDDDVFDPTLPADLWFRHRRRV